MFLAYLAVTLGLALSCTPRGPCGVALWAEERAWDELLDHGEEVGAACGTDLAGVQAHAGALPPHARDILLSGAGHQLDWAVADPEGAALAIERTLPVDMQRPLLTGVLVAVARRHAAAPEVVVETAKALRTQHDLDVLDAVRIGLQRGLGDDLPAAVAIVQRYPEAWWPALVEELGWRAGDEGLPAQQVARLGGLVPPEASAWWWHGVLRGRSEAERDLAGIVPLLDSAPEEARELAARGVAWALVQRGLGPRWHEGVGLPVPMAARIEGQRARLVNRGAPLAFAPWEPTPTAARGVVADNPGPPQTRAMPHRSAF